MRRKNKEFVGGASNTQIQIIWDFCLRLPRDWKENQKFDSFDPMEHLLPIFHNFNFVLCVNYWFINPSFLFLRSPWPKYFSFLQVNSLYWILFNEISLEIEGFLWKNCLISGEENKPGPGLFICWSDAQKLAGKLKRWKPAMVPEWFRTLVLQI